MVVTQAKITAQITPVITTGFGRLVGMGNQREQGIEVIMIRSVMLRDVGRAASRIARNSKLPAKPTTRSR